MTETKNTASAVSAEAMSEHARLMEAFDLVLAHIRARGLALAEEQKKLDAEARALRAFADEIDPPARDEVQVRAH